MNNVIDWEDVKLHGLTRHDENYSFYPNILERFGIKYSSLRSGELKRGDIIKMLYTPEYKIIDYFWKQDMVFTDTTFASPDEIEGKRIGNLSEMRISNFKDKEERPIKEGDVLSIVKDEIIDGKRYDRVLGEGFVFYDSKECDFFYYQALFEEGDFEITRLDTICNENVMKLSGNIINYQDGYFVETYIRTCDPDHK